MVRMAKASFIAATTTYHPHHFPSHQKTHPIPILVQLKKIILPSLLPNNFTITTDKPIVIA